MRPSERGGQFAWHLLLLHVMESSPVDKPALKWKAFLVIEKPEGGLFLICIMDAHRLHA